MKESVARALTGRPFLYRAASRLYWGLSPNRILERLIGTRARERQWAKRSFGKAYWENRDLPVMHLLADRIAAYSPIKSILEIGCASGPNLYQLARRFPDATLSGIDINREAVAYGNEQLAREGLANVHLTAGKADELDGFGDGEFDVVFSNAVLIYIGPDKIRKVLREMLRVARKAVVLVELSGGEGETPEGKLVGDTWARDYAGLFRELASEAAVQVSPLPPGVWPAAPWDKLGRLVTVDIAAGGGRR